MTIVIDPAVRVISENNQVFVLHPGRAKMFMADFTAESAIFLDLPGISFPAPPLADSEDTQRRIKASRRYRGWHNAGRPKDNRPVMDLKQIRPYGNAEKPRIVHEVEDLYADAKAGDLVIVPGRGYGKTVLMGEVTNDFDPDFVVHPPRYEGAQVPARRVNWLHANVAKASFSSRLIRLMQNRQAIIRVTQEADLHEVYERVYGDYVWGETSGNLIRVSADEVDLRDLTKAADLANYFAAQYIALKRGELDDFLNLGFEDAIDAYYDKAYFSGVAVEIHSPGFFGRIMRDAALASYVSAMIALSAAGVSAQDASDAIVANSANTTISICDVQLEKDVRESMDMHANYRLWKDIVCPKAESATKDVGLVTDASVRAVPDAKAPPSAEDAYAQQAQPEE